jgi:chromate transporter
MLILPGLVELSASFGKIGLFALGGGDSMLKMIGDEAVAHRHWLTADQYGSLIAIDFLFPGLTAAKIAGVIGYRVAGIAGLITAVLALNLPGIVLLATGFTLTIKYMERPIVQKILEAMKFGAIAMISAVLFDMVHAAVIHGKGTILGAALTLAFFIALEFFEAPVIGGLVAFVAAFLGLHLCGLPI